MRSDHAALRGICALGVGRHDLSRPEGLGFLASECPAEGLQARRGRHGAKGLKAPGNISLLPLPPRSPELNPQENIWQFMRANWLSNRVFKSFDDIVDHCCFAWNTLIDHPGKSCLSLAAIGSPQVIH